jgi:hypothetical protein
MVRLGRVGPADLLSGHDAWKAKHPDGREKEPSG